MFTSIIRTIISTKFQVNPLAITSFSESGPKALPPSPHELAKSQNAVGYRVELKPDWVIHVLKRLHSQFKEQY